MRKFLHRITVTLVFSTAIFIGSANAVSVANAVVDTSRVVKNSDASANVGRAERSFFTAVRNFLPFFRTNNPQDNEKVLSGVKVFPNPVVDQISLTYRLGKQSSVSIKVMDALGNEVMTLLHQELDAGPQSHVFDTNNKLTNGFYFIRVSAGGTETVVKRISVL